MKRTDITEVFPDATDEQISKIMNLNGADINKAKGEAEDLRSQLATAQSEIDSLKCSSVSEDDLNAARARVTELETELNGLKQAEEIRAMREKISAEKGVPASLLTGTSEEACAEQAESILSFAKGHSYPTVKDGGEVSKGSGIGSEWAELAAQLH